MDIYQSCPAMESDRFLMRMVRKEDCADLWKVYSDELSVPLFNSDNCHGDNFHYKTFERMAQAIDFWLFSYEHRYFVRWSIIDKQTTEAIGTIEVFRREAQDAFTDTALLRLDLRSDYEYEEAIGELVGALQDPICEWFECNTITTKAVSQAKVRRAILRKLGFQESSQLLKGHDGSEYGCYFVYKKLHKYI